MADPNGPRPGVGVRLLCLCAMALAWLFVALSPHHDTREATAELRRLAGMRAPRSPKATMPADRPGPRPGPRRLRVVIRSFMPVVMLNDPATHRSVAIDLTDEQREKLAMHYTHTVGGDDFFEEVSIAFFDDEEDADG